MRVIFCDNHLLVVFKPAGLSTQPHAGSSCDLTTLAKAWVKKTYSKPGNVFLEPVHRLDKPVSGLVLFARTSKALSRLQQMMRERQIKKTYVAKVGGTLPEQKGTLEHHLVHDDYRARVVGASHPEGKSAILHYTCLEHTGEHTVVEIALETGRYHQIRAQFAAIGCPVVGDTKYGSGFPQKGEAIALCHTVLALFHPITKEPLQYSIPFGTGA